MLKNKHLHTILAHARPKNLPFSNSLGVGKQSKTQAEALSPDPPGFLPVYNHPSALDLGRNHSRRQSLLQPGLTRAKEPIPRPPGQEALWISSPRGHRQPALSPPSPPPRSTARPRSCELCTACRGYSRSFCCTVSPQLPHPCPP